MKNWFDVDKEGLAKLLEQRGKKFALAELISNAWDQNVTEVTVALQPIPHTRTYALSVADDDPDGFKDLTHAFTLFAESEKKDKADKRGRFNLGEKLVLAVCDEAIISTTTGTVVFNDDGRSQRRLTREAGSEFSGVIRMTKAEYQECVEFVRTLIPPSGIRTVFNGEVLQNRQPKVTFQASLATDIADDQGFMRRTTRMTSVRVYEPLPDEVPSLYEMGIPVVETSDRWHIDIGQKVPLNMNRDNVPPAYLSNLRTLVLNELFKEVKGEEANEKWVRDATSNPNAAPTAVEHIITQRFGEKRVIFDPTDLEANKLAVSRGYTVIPGNSLSRQEWQHVKQNQIALPAGQVTPSPKVMVETALGMAETNPDKFIQPDRYTDGMKEIVEYTKALAVKLRVGSISVKILNDLTAPFSACYGQKELIYNVGRLGYNWFNNGATTSVNALIIHEFAHEFCSDHLAHEYHDALCSLGANLADLALKDPQFFNRYTKAVA